MNKNMLPPYIRATDKEMLRNAGCPWTTETLYQKHHKGEYPDLFRKVGKTLMIKTEELLKIVEGE